MINKALKVAKQQKMNKTIQQQQQKNNCNVTLDYD